MTMTNMTKTIEALNALVIAQSEVCRVLTELIATDPWRAGQWRHMRDQTQDDSLYAMETRVSEILQDQLADEQLKIQE